MELECQWDLVEEEVSDVFTQLLEAITKRLESLKSSLQGELLLSFFFLLFFSSFGGALLTV